MKILFHTLLFLKNWYNKESKWGGLEMERLLVCRKIPCYYFFLLILATMLEDCKESITKEKLFGATKIIMNSLDNPDFKEILQKSEIY